MNRARLLSTTTKAILLLVMFISVCIPQFAEAQSPVNVYEHGNRSSGEKYVALTFDLCSTDGAYLDMSVVNALSQNNVPATFFASGMFVQQHEQDIQNLANNKLFEIENHSWDHPNNMSDQFDSGTLDMNLQVNATNDLIEKVTGTRPQYIRLPAGNGAGYDANGIWNGSYNEPFLKAIMATGTSVLDWDVVSADPYATDPQKVFENVVNNVQNGSIVVMHGNGKGTSTAAALQLIIPRLRELGYTFVTVADMQSKIGLEPRFTDASPVVVTTPVVTPIPVQDKTVVLTVPRSGYSSSCWEDNILLGLERLGDGDSFIEIKPLDYTDYNVDIGSMETTAGFTSIDGTPAACLCDLASWVAQAAINSGLRPEATTWKHKLEVPYADRDITIWHVDQNASCFTDDKRNGTCEMPANEQDLLVYNDSQVDTVRLGWTADETQIQFWVQTSGSGVIQDPTASQQRDEYKAACGLPFDLDDSQWESGDGFHTGCDASNPCPNMLGKDYWPSAGLDVNGTTTHPTSTDVEVKLIATLNGTVTWASTTEWDPEHLNWDGTKGGYKCTSGCDGVGNSYITIDNEYLWISYFHPDKVFVSVGDTVHIGDTIGIMGDVGQSSWTHIHYIIHDKLAGKNIEDLAATFSCSFETQSSQPSVSEDITVIVTEITDLPFVENKELPPSATDIVPSEIIWQPQDSNASQDTDVIVTEDSIEVNNQDWAVTQSLDTVPNEDGQLIVTFVDSDQDGLPSPAQEKSMQAVTRIWMMVYDIPPSDVNSRRTKLDMWAERELLAKTEKPTLQSLLLLVSPYGSKDAPKTFLGLDWSSSVSISGEQSIVLVIEISFGLLVLLLVSHALNNFYQRQVDGDFSSKKRKKKEIGSVSAREYREQESNRRRLKRTQFITTMNVVLITCASVNFIVGMLMYTPVAYRPEAIVRVRTAQPAAQPTVDIPKESVSSSTTVATNESDALWQKIAEEAGYPNWKFLQTACTSHNIPRGADGNPLSEADGGKVFPCWWAASVISVETNDAEWNGVDPRNPGPWGYELGWTACPEWFKLTPSEVLAGKTISGMAQACRDGLEVIAQNPVVQSKWPGITAQQIYSSGAGAVGRGQTLAMHFRAGGLLGDLENMDVWSTDDVAVEAIVRHLVTRSNSDTCGANKNWYYTENIEQARCAYNPGAWGVEKYSWYWNGMRDQATLIQKSLQAHENELAGLPVIEVPSATSVVVHEAPNQKDEQSAPIIVSGERPTIGSGAYTVFDTLPSLALRLLREADDGVDPKYKMWERWIILFGRLYYTSEDVRVNLGFDKIPESQEVNEINIH